MHVTPLWHINMIPSQPAFALTHQWHMFSESAADTNFIVFGLTRGGLKQYSTSLKAMQISLIVVLSI